MNVIDVGDRVPDADLYIIHDEGPKTVRSSDVLGTGKVVLFGVPGAFTRTCSQQHLPGFILRADDLHAKGVDTIACLAVNDAFVMDAWAKDRGVGNTLIMLADGNGDFTRAMGLAVDRRDAGLGVRSRRYAAILENGIIRALFVEKERGLTVSSADSVLAALS